MQFNRLSSIFQMPEMGRRGHKLTKNLLNAKTSQLLSFRLSTMPVTKLRWKQADGIPENDRASVWNRYY